MTLNALGWSGATLARMLRCHRTLPLAWLSGRAQVPAVVEVWLLDLVRVHARRPPPDWRTQSASAAQIALHVGDCRAALADFAGDSFDCAVTSPPSYFVRDYGHPDQIGLEASYEQYVARLVEVFNQVHRVLRPTGRPWLHIADSRSTRRAIRLDGVRSVAKGVPVRP